MLPISDHSSAPINPTKTVPACFHTMSDNAVPENAQPPANPDAEMNDDLDAAIEADIRPEGAQPEAMNLDGANETEAAPQRNGVPEPPLEARIPAKKDATLREFLSKMDDCAPIVCCSPPHRRLHYYIRRAITYVPIDP